MGIMKSQHHRSHFFGGLSLAGLIFDVEAFREKVVRGAGLGAFWLWNRVVDSCKDRSGPLLDPLLGFRMSPYQGVKFPQSKPPELLIGEIKVIDSDCP